MRSTYERINAGDIAGFGDGCGSFGVRGKATLSDRFDVVPG
jgi:hypothetical protein